MAISQTSRGLTPPNGPIGSVGSSGSATKVIASSTSAERSSGQVMLATQPWMRSRSARIAAVATASAAADVHVADQRVGAERKRDDRRDRRGRGKVLPSARFSSRQNIAITAA